MTEKKYVKYLEWVVNELEDRHATALEYASKILKLQIELWEAQWERDWLKMVVDELHEEISRLEAELKKYKKYYDRDKEELMESCYWLAKENEKLKKENISLHLEIEDMKDDGELSYEEKLLYD